MAFWEPQIGAEFAGDLDAYRAAPARIVELHPMTIMQNALHSFGADWSWVPPRAATVGPKDILGARRRSFWLDGYLGGGVAWQRFIARLVAHGPVNELCFGQYFGNPMRLHDPRGGGGQRGDPHGLGDCGNLRGGKMTQAPLLELRGASKHFGAVQALSNVDMTINPGEIVALSVTTDPASPR